MDSGGGGGAEGELTAQETALYDRQIRVWGVDAQKRCAAAQEPTLLLYDYWPFVPLLLFLFTLIFSLFCLFFSSTRWLFLNKNLIFGGFMIYFGFVAKLMFAFSSRFWPKACIFILKTLIAAVSHVCWSPPPISAASRSHFHDASHPFELTVISVFPGTG